MEDTVLPKKKKKKTEDMIEIEIENWMEISRGPCSRNKVIR